MKPDDPRVAALAAAIIALIDGLAEGGPSATKDDLVPLTQEALAARQLEHRAVVRLAEKGELRTVKIGRRRYTRASWLAEVAEKLPADVPLLPRKAPMSKRDQLIDLLRGTGRGKRAVAS